MSISKRQKLLSSPNAQNIYNSYRSNQKKANQSESSEFNESRITNRTQRSMFKQQESILDDFGVLLSNKQKAQRTLKRVPSQKKFNLTQNCEVQQIQQWQFMAQYERALSFLNAGNQFSTRKAYQVLLNLGNTIVRSDNTERSYQVVENIILNLWRISSELGSETLHTVSLSQMVEYINVLCSLLQATRKPNNKVTNLCLIVAKEFYNAQDMTRVLEFCEKGFKYCPKVKNSQLLLKLHYLKSKVYHQIKAFAPQNEEIKKCLFFLKNITQNSSENIEFAKEFLKILNSRKDELKKMLQQRNTYDFKSRKRLGQKNGSMQLLKTRIQNSKSTPLSLNKLRTRSTSASKIKTATATENIFKETVKRSLHKNTQSQSQVNKLVSTQTKKEFYRFDNNKKGKLKKKGYTVWEKQQQLQNFQKRVAQQLQSVDKRQNSHLNLHRSHTKVNRFQGMLLRRPNISSRRDQQEYQTERKNQNNFIQLEARKKPSDNYYDFGKKQKELKMPKRNDTANFEKNESDSHFNRMTNSHDQSMLKRYIANIQEQIFERYLSKQDQLKNDQLFKEEPTSAQNIDCENAQDPYNQTLFQQQRKVNPFGLCKNSYGFSSDSQHDSLVSQQQDAQEEHPFFRNQSNGQRKLQQEENYKVLLMQGQHIVTSFGIISKLCIVIDQIQQQNERAEQGGVRNIWKIKIYSKINQKYFSCTQYLPKHNMQQRQNPVSYRHGHSLYSKFYSSIFSKQNQAKDESANFKEKDLDQTRSSQDVINLICAFLSGQYKRRANFFQIVQQSAESLYHIFEEREKNFIFQSDTFDKISRIQYQKNMSAYGANHSFMKKSSLQLFYISLEKTYSNQYCLQSNFPQYKVKKTNIIKNQITIDQNLSEQRTSQQQIDLQSNGLLNMSFQLYKSKLNQLLTNNPQKWNSLSNYQEQKQFLIQNNKFSKPNGLEYVEKNPFNILIINSQKFGSYQKLKKPSFRKSQMISATLRLQKNFSNLQFSKILEASESKNTEKKISFQNIDNGDKSSSQIQNSLSPYQNIIIQQGLSFQMPCLSVMSKVLKYALIQPEYKSSNLLQTYYDYLEVSSFFNIMDSKPTYIKLTCFRMKAVYIGKEEDMSLFYLFQLRQRQARARMYKFIMDDVQMEVLLSPKMLGKRVKGTTKILGVIGSQSGLSEKVINNQFAKQKPKRKSNFQYGKSFSKMPTVNKLIKSERNRKCHTVKFSKNSLTSILKTLSPHFTLTKNYLYTNIGIDYRNDTFYLTNKFRIDENTNKSILSSKKHAGVSENSLNKPNYGEMSSLLSSFSYRNNEFISKQIKAKKVLCQKSILINIQRQPNTYKISQRIRKKKYYAIISVLKIEKSFFFTIKLYVPFFQKSFTISLDKQILRYFKTSQIKQLFDEFLNENKIQHTQNDKIKCQYLLKELELLQNKLHQNVTACQADLMFRQLYNLDQCSEQQKKQKLLNQLSEFIFESKAQYQKLIWKKIIDCIRVEEKKTEDKMYLIVRIFGYHGFIKDCSFDEYFEKNGNIYLMEMCLDKKVNQNNRYKKFPTQSDILQKESGVCCFRLSKQTSKKLPLNQRVSSQKSKFLEPQKSQIIDPSVLNDKSSEFQTKSCIYESKCSEHTLYLQIFQVSSSSSAQTDTTFTTKTIDRDLRDSSCDNQNQSLIDKSFQDPINSSNVADQSCLRMNSNIIRKKSHKNTIKTSKSISFFTKQMQEKNLRRGKKPRQRKIKTGRQLDAGAKQDQGIMKLNISFYLTELIGLFKNVDQHFCQEFSEEFFTMAQIRNSLKLLKDIVLGQFQKIEDVESLFCQFQKQKMFKHSILQNLAMINYGPLPNQRVSINVRQTQQASQPKFISLHCREKMINQSEVYLISLNILSPSASRLCSLFYLKRNLLFLISGTKKFSIQAMAVKQSSNPFNFISCLLQKQNGLKCVKSRLFKFYKNAMMASYPRLKRAS